MKTLTDETLKRLFYDHYQELCRHANSYLGSEDESEDVVQQVFASYWEQHREQPVMDNIRAYLYTAVGSRCLNVLNREGMKNRRHDMGAAELVAPAASAPTDSEATLSELKKAVEQALLELAPTTRQAFVLSRHHGLSQKEIAEVLDCTIKNVEYHMSRALKHLRLRLADFMVLILIACGGMS